MEYLSNTIYGGFLSDFNHMYCMSGKTMDREFKKNYPISCREVKELLRQTRDNPVLVSMSGRRKLVLRCTKGYVKKFVK